MTMWDANVFVVEYSFTLNNDLFISCCGLKMMNPLPYDTFMIL